MEKNIPPEVINNIDKYCFEPENIIKSLSNDKKSKLLTLLLEDTAAIKNKGGWPMHEEIKYVLNTLIKTPIDRSNFAQMIARSPASDEYIITHMIMWYSSLNLQEGPYNGHYALAHNAAYLKSRGLEVPDNYVPPEPPFPPLY
jgi:hypothetical protein